MEANFFQDFSRTNLYFEKFQDFSRTKQNSRTSSGFPGFPGSPDLQDCTQFISDEYQRARKVDVTCYIKATVFNSGLAKILNIKHI